MTSNSQKSSTSLVRSEAGQVTLDIATTPIPGYADLTRKLPDILAPANTREPNAVVALMLDFEVQEDDASSARLAPIQRQVPDFLLTTQEGFKKAGFRNLQITNRARLAEIVLDVIAEDAINATLQTLGSMAMLEKYEPTEPSGCCWYILRDGAVMVRNRSFVEGDFNDRILPGYRPCIFEAPGKYFSACMFSESSSHAVLRFSQDAHNLLRRLASGVARFSDHARPWVPNLQTRCHLPNSTPPTP